MTREELQDVFSTALKDKLVGTKHNDRVIEDVSVRLYETESDYDENFNYSVYETIKIEVKTSSPKGRVSTWHRYDY